MSPLVHKIILAIIMGLIAWGFVYLIGLALTLIPYIVPLGQFLQFVSPFVGIIVGILSFITDRTKPLL